MPQHRPPETASLPTADAIGRVETRRQRRYGGRYWTRTSDFYRVKVAL